MCSLSQGVQVSASGNTLELVGSEISDTENTLRLFLQCHCQCWATKLAVLPDSSCAQCRHVRHEARAVLVLGMLLE